MRLQEDREFQYAGYFGCRSICRIRIFEENGRYLVIATEREDNPGTSITNAAENVAWAVWRYLECPEHFTWVEHYQDRAKIGGKFTLKENFDIVTFKKDARKRFCSPDWHPSNKSVIEQLTGCPV